MSDSDVLVVGAGPAGLATAVALREAGLSVTVVDRESEAGGIPRHTDHTGYGRREFRRLMRGPEYARRWVDRAARAGVELRVATSVTGWRDGNAATRTVTVTSPDGVSVIEAGAVVLATGCRERPRPARLVPGTRPLGVLTTGSVQQLAAAGIPVGDSAVVVGAEHVSFSALLTLRHAGCRVAAMVTRHARDQTYAPLRWATATRYRVPIVTGATVAAITGRRRVEAVEVADIDGANPRRIDCDTVVFTGDWAPDSELARRGSLTMDTASMGPRVDAALRTSAPGVFAAGNLLHAAETAGRCARDGAWVARRVHEWLQADSPWPAAPVPVECGPPLRWVFPSALTPGQAELPYGWFLARSEAWARRPELVVRQGERELWRGRLRGTVPNRPVRIPSRWAAQVEPGSPVRIEVAG